MSISIMQGPSTPKPLCFWVSRGATCIQSQRRSPIAILSKTNLKKKWIVFAALVFFFNSLHWPFFFFFLQFLPIACLLTEHLQLVRLTQKLIRNGWELTTNSDLAILLYTMYILQYNQFFLQSNDVLNKRLPPTVAVRNSLHTKSYSRIHSNYKTYQAHIRSFEPQQLRS